jgi:hypothetical protein
MNIALNREATAHEATHKANGQFEALPLDVAFSKAMRELAEKSVGQTREAYERSKNALEAAVDTMARSFDALGQGTAALNRKVIEIAQENVSSGFDKELGHSQDTRRAGGVASDLLAQAAQHTRGPS